MDQDEINAVFQTFINPNLILKSQAASKVMWVLYTELSIKKERPFTTNAEISKFTCLDRTTIHDIIIKLERMNIIKVAKIGSASRTKGDPFKKIVLIERGESLCADVAFMKQVADIARGHLNRS